jgi:hypothetical protein
MKKLVLMSLVLLVMSCGTKKEEKVEEVKEDLATEKVELEETEKFEPFDVEIKIDTYFEGGKFYIEGETNLPEEMDLMATIMQNGIMIGQSSLKIKDRKFKSEGLSQQGEPFRGKLEISISSPLPELQENSLVKKKIGKDGENLKGKYTVINEWESGRKFTTVEFVEIIATNKKEKTENKKYTIQKDYSELISFYFQKSSPVESGKFNKEFIIKINQEKEKYKSNIELYAAYGDLITLAMELDNKNIGQKYDQEFINFVENNMKNFK